jgi:hypothetical protein
MISKYLRIRMGVEVLMIYQSRFHIGGKLSRWYFCIGMTMTVSIPGLWLHLGHILADESLFYHINDPTFLYWMSTAAILPKNLSTWPLESLGVELRTHKNESKKVILLLLEFWSRLESRTNIRSPTNHLQQLFSGH